MKMTVLAGALCGALAFATGVPAANAAIRTQALEYRHGDAVLEGYLAYDDALQGKRPGVLVFHEWMGPSEYEQRRARELAQLGYVALAADIYGKGVRPKNREEASAQAGRYRGDRPLLRARAAAALDALRAVERVDGSRVAAIGYCFGGGAALELARSGADLRGVVSFHGNLDTPNPDDARNIKGSVLVLTGADDPGVPAAQRQAFQEAMTRAGKDWQMVLYSGAVHAFTNPRSGNDPSRGAAYNEKADRRSWEAMRQFLAEVFA